MTHGVYIMLIDDQSLSLLGANSSQCMVIHALWWFKIVNCCFRFLMIVSTICNSKPLPCLGIPMVVVSLLVGYCQHQAVVVLLLVGCIHGCGSTPRTRGWSHPVTTTLEQLMGRSSVLGMVMTHTHMVLWCTHQKSNDFPKQPRLRKPAIAMASHDVQQPWFGSQAYDAPDMMMRCVRKTDIRVWKVMIRHDMMLRCEMRQNVKYDTRLHAEWATRVKIL